MKAITISENMLDHFEARSVELTAAQGRIEELEVQVRHAEAEIAGYEEHQQELEKAGRTLVACSTKHFNSARDLYEEVQQLKKTIERLEKVEDEHALLVSLYKASLDIRKTEGVSYIEDDDWFDFASAVDNFTAAHFKAK